MNVVDTNVLFYAHDAREPSKQAAALDLIQNLPDGVLLWQVACEYISASRKLALLGHQADDAYTVVSELQGAWTTVLPTWRALELSQRYVAQYGFSFWDALLVAAAVAAGAVKLYSEDFGDRESIDGLQFVNPFAPPSRTAR
jgi:predicted nucleic acid-binding protein